MRHPQVCVEKRNYSLMPKLFGKRSKPPALAAGRVFEVTSSEIGGSTTLLSNSSSDAPEDSHADSEEALVLSH